jgi:hypothetical protein
VGRTCRNQKLSLCAKERIFVYKLDSFVGFIGDEQLHAQECYVSYLKIRFCTNHRRSSRNSVHNLLVH